MNTLYNGGWVAVVLLILSLFYWWWATRPPFVVWYMTRFTQPTSVRFTTLRDAVIFVNRVLLLDCQIVSVTFQSQTGIARLFDVVNRAHKKDMNNDYDLEVFRNLAEWEYSRERLLRELTLEVPSCPAQ